MEPEPGSGYNPDIQRWNDKYSRSLSSGDPVVPRLEPELDQLRDHLECEGLALEVACGKGANALALAALGYDTIACDLAINGLAQSLAADKPSQGKFMPLVCDAGTYGFPADTFSLVCAIRFLDRNLFASLERWIKPGGLLFYKTFNSEFLNINPRFNPDYLVDLGELNSAFGGMDILASNTRPADQVMKSQPGGSFILARKSRATA